MWQIGVQKLTEENVRLKAEADKARTQAIIADLEAQAARCELDLLASGGIDKYLGVQPTQIKPVQQMLPAMNLSKRGPGRPRKDDPRVTAAQMRALILKGPGRVEACLLLLWSYQTQDERQAGETTYRNGRGFSKAHVSAAKTMVDWIKGHGNRVMRDPMTGVKLHTFPFSLLKNQSTTLWAVVGKQLVMHYARQLAEISNERGHLPWGGPFEGKIPDWT